MEITDKEQARHELKKTPQYKKKEIIRNLLYGVGIVVFLVVAFFYYRSPAYTGTPYLIQMAGITIEPGKTTVQELVDAGFDISDGMIVQKPTIYDVSTPVMGKSYTELLSLMKDGKIHATLVVMNTESGKKPMAQCKVREIAVDEYNEEDQNIVLDGVKFPELTAAFFTENRGKPYDAYTSQLPDGSTAEIAVWEDAHYSLQLEVAADGTFHRFQASYE